MVLIAPSLLSADVSNLGKEVCLLEKAQADLLHFDVMDGHFVPNLTYGPMILSALKKQTSLPFDVHLMVENPEIFIDWYAKAGADIITFHLEATENPDKLIKLIKQYHLRAGVSLRPNTDLNVLGELSETPDLVLVMGVQPGFGGQAFFEDTPDRIRRTRKIFTNKNIQIEVDGGINPTTAPLCIDAGADILVAGSYIFNQGNYAKNIKTLKGEQS